jgi:hypothetical protein
MSSDLKAGAAKSLNKTISEIMEFMDDDDKRPAKKLRNFLRKTIGDLNERWFRKGFNRGHIQSFEAFGDDGDVPKVLRYECNRNLFTGQERIIKLKSKLKNASRAR